MDILVAIVGCVSVILLIYYIYILMKGDNQA